VKVYLKTLKKIEKKGKKANLMRGYLVKGSFGRVYKERPVG